MMEEADLVFGYRNHVVASLLSMFQRVILPLSSVVKLIYYN